VVHRPGRSTGLAVAVAFLLLAGLAPARGVQAGELGHYFPGGFNVRDYIMPDKGVYAAVYTIYYGSDSVRDASGDEISSVRIAGRTVNLDTELDLYSIAPAVLWNTGWSILGGEYGAYVSVPFGGPSVGVALSTSTGRGVDTDTSAFGLQDLYVQPIWLRWKWEDFDLSGSVGFYAPVGRFEAGESDNLGLGFWTVQFQVGGAYYLLKRATAIVLAGTYEINSEQEDVDVTPGQRFTLNYGVSQFLPAGPGLVELGLIGYSQWQVTHDDGSDVSNFNSNLDQVHAIGGQVGYAIPKWRLGVTLKYLYEYYAEARFRGQVATLSVGYQF
jgi:hypothetical protein